MTLIPFNKLIIQDPAIQREISKAMEEVFESGHYILGDRLNAFEKDFSTYIGVKHCIGVGNGLDALKISLKAIGIEEGDEVIVPANTYIATLLAVSEVGAVPVLVEPDVDTHTIDVNKIEAKISKQTKAIIPVHLYGMPCDMDGITGLAKKHTLFVIEDNAQSIGAECKGLKTGAIGHINAHSFYPTKNLGAIGDGGAITTNDEQLAKKVRLLRNYGSEMKYQHEVLGYNSRLDEIQAAVLSVKLKHLDSWNEERIILVEEYTKRLASVAGITVLNATQSNLNKHVYHLYVVRVKERERLMKYLLEQGISTAIHYPIPPYRQHAYDGFFNTRDFPVTEMLSREVLSLPLYQGLGIYDIERITEAIAAFYKK